MITLTTTVFFVSLISSVLLYRVGMFKSDRIPSDRDFLRLNSKSEQVHSFLRALLVFTILSWITFFILLI